MSEKKKGIFSKELSFGKKGSKTKYPEKNYINLIQKEKKGNNGLAIGLFVLFIIVLAVFTRVAVVGQLEKVAIAERQYNSMLSQLNAMKEKNKEYDEVKSKYDTVTDWYMTEAEKTEVDKTNVFRMLEEDLMPYVGLSNVQVSGKTITIQTNVTNLQTVSQFLNKLQSDKRNGYVTVTTASADKTVKDAKKNDVIASIVITYGGSEGGN
jgi:hypothetical protein